MLFLISFTGLFRYADGECSVTIKETVMGKDVFVVSPTHSNDSLIEMLLMIAAARRWVFIQSQCQYLCSSTYCVFTSSSTEEWQYVLQ